MWTGSILKDEEIDAILRKAGATIAAPKIGDASPTQSQGEGSLSAPTAVPATAVPNPQKEQDDKKKIQETVQEQLQRSMPQNGWFESMFGRDAETSLLMLSELLSAKKSNQLSNLYHGVTTTCRPYALLGFRIETYNH